MSENCYVNVNDELIEAEFVGVYQYSNVLGESPLIGGHRGGVRAFPVAVVKYGGKLHEAKISEVTFKE